MVIMKSNNISNNKDDYKNKKIIYIYDDNCIKRMYPTNAF